MNSENSELYQDLILEHGRNPKNRKKLEAHTHTHEGFNPLCGDRVIVYMVVEKNVIQDIGFEGTGCAISMASASLMTERLKGKTVEGAKSVLQSFYHLVTKELKTLSKEEQDQLGEKLLVLKNVQKYPMRVKCATLAWHTMENALKLQKM